MNGMWIGVGMEGWRRGRGGGRGGRGGGLKKGGEHAPAYSLKETMLVRSGTYLRKPKRCAAPRPAQRGAAVSRKPKAAHLIALEQ